LKPPVLICRYDEFYVGQVGCLQHFPTSLEAIIRIERIVVIFRLSNFNPMRTRLISKLTVAVSLFLGAVNVSGQQPVIVQPGAPGQASKMLPNTTRPTLPPTSHKDVEFMQGMIMHHAQAVEMTDMIAERTKNRDILLLGERISKSQSDEMAFMKRWLETRGQSTEMKMATPAHNSHSHGGHASASDHRMPGMLTPEQMDALRKAKGADFDMLFLKGMIQHHEGALVMVKDLFDSAGSGQDAELFNFASDVDSGQRAEIASMQNLLGSSHVKH
jgi:uncharacterized protein (DUF305 family)